MNILLLGKNGQLGWELRRTLAPLGPMVALDYADLDLNDFDALRLKVRELRPELIVNAAAYTNVDRAEAEPEQAQAINATIPGILAEEAKKMRSALIHYSTDYVFDGSKGQPYVETDVPNPLNVYGESKLAGERAVQAASGAYLVLRTAWVYSFRGDSFVTKVLKWARQSETLRIVDDQISNPTWARMLAEVTAQVLGRGVDVVRERKGIYHLAGRGYASRYEWAREILNLDPQRHEQTVRQLLPASTREFPAPARRPSLSALDSDRFSSAFNLELQDWRTALLLAMQLARLRRFGQ